MNPCEACGMPPWQIIRGTCHSCRHEQGSAVDTRPLGIGVL